MTTKLGSLDEDEFARSVREEEERVLSQVRLQRLERNMRSAGLEARFTFAKWENRTDVRDARVRRAVLEARKDAESWADTFKPGCKGLLITGTYGSGKTHLAQAIGWTVVENGYTVLFRSAPYLLAELRASFNRPKEDDGLNEGDILLGRLQRVDLLILDDLGRDKPSEWVEQTLFTLLDARWRGERTTVVTTNCALDVTEEERKRNPPVTEPELARQIGGAVFSRALGMTDTLPLAAPDYRLRRSG